MRDTGKASLGQAVANIIGESIHRAILSILPHAHAEQTRHRLGVWQEIADSCQTELQPLLNHVLDTGKVHPVIEPTLRRLAGKGDAD